MPKAAWLGSADEEAFVRRIIDQEDFYRSALQRPFDMMQEFWRLYMADRPDLRKKGEKWRANVSVPLPFANVEMGVASLIDILGAADPAIQAEGVQQKDEEDARAITEYLDYELRCNRWGRTQDQLFRSMAIQGITIPKLTWQERFHTVTSFPNQKEVDTWRQAVKEAEIATKTACPEDTVEYDAWAENVEYVLGRRLPSIPTGGPKKIIQYRGPLLSRIPLTSLRYDPLIEEIDDHTLIIHRAVKPLKWVEDRTGTGREKLFDPQQVADATAGWDGKKLDEWQEQQAQLMGVDVGQIGDPIYEKAVELWEAWAPNGEKPYSVILNRSRVINKKPDTSPLMHGCFPFIPIRNVPVPGQFHGQSELQQTKKLYNEMDVMRSMRLDAVLLKIMPVFAKLREVGLTDAQREMRPGMLIDVPRIDAIKQLLSIDGQGLMEAFREIPSIKDDINEAYGTYEHLKGAASQVGRVSATESERRFSQAQVRQKQRAMRIEEELQPFVDQSLFLWYQFGDDEALRDIAGKNALRSIPRERFLEALNMKFRFRGATKTLNRDMTAQQLLGFLQNMGERLTAGEYRATMQRYLETIGVKGIDKLITAEGTSQMVNMEQMQLAAAMQGQAGAAAAPPTEVSGAEAEALQNETGPEEGVEQPPPVEGQPA